MPAAPRKRAPARKKAVAKKPAARAGAKRAPTKRRARRTKESAERVVVENVNVPGYATSVDAAKYAAMRQALLKALPAAKPGLTQAEMLDAVLPHLPEALFPGGEKAGWWVKCVQLDLEAKRLVARDGGKPLRWRRA